MKKITIYAILAFAGIMSFTSCKTQPDADAVRKEVLNLHDKVMIDGEKVIKNKMILDTLLQKQIAKKSADTASIADIINRLNKADENMMDWMHFFKDDFKGKSEEENLAYYQSQMIKIRGVEDEYIQSTRVSDSLIKVYSISLPQSTSTSHHKH
ncbi:hypothetical protein [Pedobacter sandarakinus]|uniref:hypothetical protein n=1 Tax=Pedobacter sandarakinus TaxID=353156 RepID=UPI0022479A4D|nr:hypothetical protein [Pedobacter sandarakinus]MCX2574369.1 hypothetical protein [Pedobacter sandarakinus]